MGARVRLAYHWSTTFRLGGAVEFSVGPFCYLEPHLLSANNVPSSSLWREAMSKDLIGDKQCSLMVRYCQCVLTKPTIRRTQTHTRSRCLERHRVRVAFRHPVKHPAAGDGLRLAGGGSMPGKKPASGNASTKRCSPGCVVAICWICSAPIVDRSSIRAMKEKKPVANQPTRASSAANITSSSTRQASRSRSS